VIGLDASNVNAEALFRLRLPLVDFAILKATEGLTFVDPFRPTRAAQVRALGKALGFYHFDRSNDDGISQARFFVRIADPQPGDTLWLDMETADAQSWATVAGRAADFLRTVGTLTGAKCGLYSDRSELVAVIAAADPVQRTLLEAAPLWFADPSHAQGHPSCPLPWAIHQYGSAGGLDANVTNPAFVWAAMAVPGSHPAPTPAPTPIPPTPLPTPAPSDPKESAVLLFQDSTGIYFLTGAGTVHVPSVADVALLRSLGVPFANPLSDAFGTSLRGTP